MWEMKNTYKILVGKTEGKRELGRPRGTWEGVDWNHLAQDRDQW
jgi:hypothetical protein